MIRLKKDAPWNSVALPPNNVEITKTQWIDESLVNILPIKKWVENETQVEAVPIGKYDTVSNIDLINVAKQRGVFDEFKTRDKIIKLLEEDDSKPQKEEKDYTKLNKKELAELVKEKGKWQDGMSKSKMVEALNGK